MKSSNLTTLFEVENARNMSRERLAATFVPTEEYQRLLSPKNHVIIGSRGSGKTAVVKMLAHDHLAELARQGESLARETVHDRSLIGLYISTRTEWVGSLKNKHWKTGEEKEHFFQWRLNTATCKALVTSLQSCLNEYIDDDYNRYSLERKLVKDLAGAWVGRQTIRSLVELRRHLEDLEYQYDQILARRRVLGQHQVYEDRVGTDFNLHLFRPLKRGIQLATRHIDALSDSNWILSIDEAEFLDADHHRILNTHLRADSDKLFYKVTTTPYRHHTLATNSGASLKVGHDFSYIYLDKNPRPHQEQAFAERLFSYQLRYLNKGTDAITLERILGPSLLLETKSSHWTPDSDEFHDLQSYASTSLIDRARRLYEQDKERFRNEIVRKVHGLVKLRNSVEQEVGNVNTSIYSGAKMVARCGDFNPRRLIRMFNALLHHLPDDIDELSPPIISASVQSDTIIKFSARELARTKSEPDVGDDLYGFLNALGTYMHDHLHRRPLTGDDISSVDIDQSIDEYHWLIIEHAVESGLMFPVINRNHPNQLPYEDGRFHLANVLAPHFRLLPRRGKAVSLATILHGHDAISGPPSQPDLWSQSD